MENTAPVDVVSPPADLSPRDAVIVKAKVEGKTGREAAALADCSERTVKRTTAEFRDLIEELRQEMAEKFLESRHEVVAALVATATDPENRNQIGAFKEACEKLVGWGLKPATTVVAGDVNLSIDLSDKRTQAVHLMDREARQRRIAELDLELGLG